jgi:IclR family acetate operon transcriptional repressor
MRFDRHTAKTIVTRAAFETELRRIRAAGYATDDEEHIEGIRCIAMPVFGHAGQVLGSLCTLGPKSRMSYQKLRELRRPVGELARRLSERLGYDA